MYHNKEVPLATHEKQLLKLTAIAFGLNPSSVNTF